MIKLCVFLSSFLFTDWFTMATDHQNPASKQQQPGASAFKVKGKTIIHKSLHASLLDLLIKTLSFVPQLVIYDQENFQGCCHELTASCSNLKDSGLEKVGSILVLCGP